MREPGINVVRQLMRGSLWMVGLRWATRGIGILSTIVLARLLTPRDFGIVAMAMLVVGALETLSDTGQKLALIRHPAPDRSYYDTAWTLSTLIGCVLAAAIYAVAPLTVRYFHEPDAVTVIECLAVRALLGGFENPGVADFRRNLNFRRDFLYNFAQKLGAFCVTVPAAFILRDYWAIVAGILGSRTVAICLSYVMHPHRPRWDLSRVREIWSFSIWILADNIAFYVMGKVDETVVGGMNGAGPMGRYSVASDVASSPVVEIAYPATHAQFPVIARVQHDPARAKEAFLGLLGAVATICASVGTGVSLVAHDFVAVFLGSKWLDIAALMPWIALDAAVFHCVNPASVFFQVTGSPQLAARLTWLRVGALLVALPAAGRFGNLEIVAAARFAVSFAIAPLVLVLLARTYAIPGRRLIGILWRPLGAAVMMAGIVLLFLHGAVAFPAALRLAVTVALGVAVYGLAMAGLWALSGYPPGLEASLVDGIGWRLRNSRGASKAVATELAVLRRDPPASSSR